MHYSLMGKIRLPFINLIKIIFSSCSRFLIPFYFASYIHFKLEIKDTTYTTRFASYLDKLSYAFKLTMGMAKNETLRRKM